MTLLAVLARHHRRATLTLSGTFANATVGVAYSSDLTIAGGDGAYSNPRVTVGALPGWATLSVVGAMLRLSGTPSGGATTISMTVAVDSGDGQTATSAQSVVVSAVSDPYWANVSALLYFDEVSGSTFVDQVPGNTWTAAGAIGASTAAGNPFGAGGSAQFSGGKLTSQNSARFGFGSGAYTIEGFINLLAYATNKCIVDFRSAGSTGIGIYSSEDGSHASNRLVLANNVAKIAGDLSPQWPNSTWVHWAVCRDGSGNVRGFIGGVLSWTVTDARTYSDSAPCVIGTDGTTPSLSNMSQVRVTKGVARYITDFAPPTAPFPNS